MPTRRGPEPGHRAILLSAAAALLAAGPATARAQEAEPLERRVDAVFAEYNRTDSPGCALGVYRDGEIAYARGYGMADLEQSVAITSRTVFDIGSTSKQFTAASLALLAQDGRLSLDDDVREHIPELPEYGRPITIRQMLNHTSGLRDYIGLLIMGGADIDDVTRDDEALAAVVRQRALNFEPGSEWLYSNSGYFLPSVIVKRVTGRTLPEFAEERIFGPLGMRHSRFRDDYTLVIPNRATAYSPLPEGGYAIDMSNWQQAGDGAVFTTVEDLLLWDRNYYEPTVGGERLLRDLQTRGLLNSGDTLDYALGLFLDEYRGLRTVSHGGSWGGYRAELMRFPDERFSVAVLCNLATTNPSALARQVADVYLEDRLSPAPAAAAVASAPAGRAGVELTEAQLRRWVGTYWDRAGGDVRVVELEGGELVVRTFGGWTLRPVSPTEFVVLDAPAAITIAFEAGAPTRLVQTINGRPTTFERVETVAPSAAELGAYAGGYHSAELAATYEVRLAGDVLELVPPGGAGVVRLSPLQRDVFHGGGMSLRFQRQGRGVSGFLLDRGRVRGLAFERVR